MPGPMGGRPPRGAKPTVANPGKVFKRIIGFVAAVHSGSCMYCTHCIFYDTGNHVYENTY